MKYIIILLMLVSTSLSAQWSTHFAVGGNFIPSDKHPTGLSTGLNIYTGVDYEFNKIKDNGISFKTGPTIGYYSFYDKGAIRSNTLGISAMFTTEHDIEAGVFYRHAWSFEHLYGVQGRLTNTLYFIDDRLDLFGSLHVGRDTYHNHNFYTLLIGLKFKL